MEPKPEDLYTQIKNHLISSFSISEETRLRRLLRGEVISEGKPSLLLNRLRALNNGSCSDTVIKSVFLEQMPSNIRAILAMSNFEDLQELANLADKVSEAAQPFDYRVASASAGQGTPFGTVAVSEHVAPLSSLTEILITQFKKLSDEIKNIKNSSQPRGRSNSGTFRRRIRARSNNTPSHCFYHQRFSKNAKKCTQPCSWRTDKTSEN